MRLDFGTAAKYFSLHEVKPPIHNFLKNNELNLNTKLVKFSLSA